MTHIFTSILDFLLQFLSKTIIFTSQNYIGEWNDNIWVFWSGGVRRHQRATKCGKLSIPQTPPQTSRRSQLPSPLCNNMGKIEDSPDPSPVQQNHRFSRPLPCNKWATLKILHVHSCPHPHSPSRMWATQCTILTLQTPSPTVLRWVARGLEMIQCYNVIF